MSAAEHDRMIGGIAVVGTVCELDAAAARVRVECNGNVTDWLPWIERRAGAGARTWNPPRLDEQVLVVSPCGNMALGVVVGSIYQDAYPAPADSEGVDRTVYADGTTVEYDHAANRLTVDAGTASVVIRCNTATVEAAESVRIDTPEATFTGDVKVTGEATFSADVKVSGEVRANGEVYSGSIALTTHKHTSAASGSPTSPPTP